MATGDAGPKHDTRPDYDTPKLCVRPRNQTDREDWSDSKEGQPYKDASKITANVRVKSENGSNPEYGGLTPGKRTSGGIHNGQGREGGEGAGAVGLPLAGAILQT